MTKKILLLSTIIVSASFLVACGKKADVAEQAEKTTAIPEPKVTAKKIEDRWYTTAQLLRGKKVFNNNCAVCHGPKGEGLVADWKKPDASGKFPAPPLNGTAHTWHHSKDLLMRTC